MAALVDALGDGDQLVYWGFSYGASSSPSQLRHSCLMMPPALLLPGTILGATFAAMFPERVGRMVLDGVSRTPASLACKPWLFTDALDVA